MLHVSNKGKEFYQIDSRSDPKDPDVEAGTKDETGTEAETETGKDNDAGSRKCFPNQKYFFAFSIIIEICFVVYFFVKLFY